MTVTDTTEQNDTGWIEIQVEADAESVEPVSELFSRFAYNQGVVIHEPYVQDQDGDNLVIDPSRPVGVSAYLPVTADLDDVLRRIEEGLWHLRQLGQVGDMTAASRPEEDWANAWKEHFQVTRIGRHFVIRPTWREYDAAPDDVVIDLDPGMAFGTGMHPTTELCLRWLEETPLQGARMMDAGAGSGILSIAAAKLGAREIDAVEIDPIAVKALNQNIALNDLGHRIHTSCGDVTVEVPSDQPYDIVVANIISRILVDAAPIIGPACRPGGTLILSGVIEAHEADVVAIFNEAGFDVQDRRVGGDWVSLLTTKRG